MPPCQKNQILWITGSDSYIIQVSSCHQNRMGLIMKKANWLILFFLIGCGSYGGRYFKTLSPYVGEIADSSKTKVLGTASGRACLKIFWFGPIILPLSTQGDLRSATQDALDKFTKSSGSVYLMNAYEMKTFILIPLPIGYYESCSEVDGEAISPLNFKSKKT